MQVNTSVIFWQVASCLLQAVSLKFDRQQGMKMRIKAELHKYSTE